MTKRELLAILNSPDIHADTIIIMSDVTGHVYTHVEDVTVETDDWLIEHTGEPAVVIWPVY